MTVNTWVSVGALLGVLVTLGGLVLAQGRSLGRTIIELRTELKGDIGRLDGKVDGLRTELKADIAALRTELRADIGRLDDRVYALGVGLRLPIEEAQRSAASGE